MVSIYPESFEFFFIKPWSKVHLSETVLESMTQPYWLKVKVTVESHGISYPLHITFKPGMISIKLW